MPRAEQFEDLIAWQKARHLTNEIYRAIRSTQLSIDFALTNRLKRAAISIGANIAESFDRHSLSEYHQFLVIAKGSCAEVRALPYTAHDAGYLTNGRFEELRNMALEVSRILAGLRAAVDRSRQLS